MHEYENLIKCEDGKYAPWCVVCVHLLEGTSHRWIRIPMQDGRPDDWLCPACFAKGPDGLGVDDLAALCIHCVRKRQRQERLRRLRK